MKGVVFWFSLFSPEKKKKMTSSSFPRYFILFACHKCSRWIVGELTFNSLTKSPHNTLFIFIMFSYHHWAYSKSHLSSVFSMVEMLPGFYNYEIINSAASSEAPRSDPSASSWSSTTPADREHQTGVWKGKSLPYPTPPALPHLNIIQL